MAKNKRKNSKPGKQKVLTQTSRMEVSASGAEASTIVEARRPPGIGGKYILGQWTYHLPSLPISPKEIKETFTADVIVVGAGTSGKAAALTAALAGARVIQIDRHTTFRYSGGHIAAIDSRVQKRLGIRIEKDDVCLQLMRWGANYPDQRFYRLWADNSGATLDWVMDMTDPEGIQTLMYQWPRPAGFDPKKEYYPEFPVAHFQTDGTNKTLDHSLSLKHLEKHALKHGVEIRYQTRAMQLIRKENGRVTGVIALDKGGRYIQFNAVKAVVMCTGDYGNNPWMMQKYCPIAADIALENNIYMTRNEDLRVAPEPLDTGDGHQMVMRIGGVMQSAPHAPMAHATAGPLGNAPFLRVNVEGERYENEDVTAQSISNSLSWQPGKRAWQVFDSKWEEEIKRMGVGLGRFFEINPIVRMGFETQTVRADTLEDLAKKIDVPVKDFKATVERYNQLARGGRDLDYAKYPERLTPIDKPPFYAGLSKREFLVVLGGLNTNLRLQPLDADRKVIPGLYLAGNMVGNRFAVDYPVMCAGLSHGLAYVTGRLAGQYAAAETG
jgi:fumarate reductase flavoprotein subunit